MTNFEHYDVVAIEREARRLRAQAIREAVVAFRAWLGRRRPAGVHRPA